MLDTLIRQYDPIRRSIMSALYPADIVSLTTAIGIEPTTLERNFYAQPLFQVFHSLAWIPEAQIDGITVTVVGKDLHRLTKAIEAWDYHAIPKDISLLVMLFNGEGRGFLPKREDSLEWKYIVGKEIIGSPWWSARCNFPPLESERQLLRKSGAERPWVCIMSCHSRRIAIDEEWTERLWYSSCTEDTQGSSIPPNIQFQTWFMNICNPTPALIVSRGTNVSWGLGDHLGGNLEQRRIISLYSISARMALTLSTVM